MTRLDLWCIRVVVGRVVIGRQTESVRVVLVLLVGPIAGGGLDQGRSVGKRV